MHSSTTRVNFSDTVTSVPAPKTPPVSLVNSVTAHNIIKPQQSNKKWNTFIMAAATIMVAACLIYVIMRIIKISRNITSVEYFMDKEKECAPPEIGDSLCDVQTCHHPANPTGACQRPADPTESRTRPDQTYTESVCGSPQVRANGRVQMTSLRVRPDAVKTRDNESGTNTFVPNILPEIHVTRAVRFADVVTRDNATSYVVTRDATNGVVTRDNATSATSVSDQTSRRTVDVVVHDETINVSEAATPSVVAGVLQSNVGERNTSAVDEASEKSDDDANNIVAPPQADRRTTTTTAQTAMDMSEISESLMQSLEIFDAIHIQNPAEMILLGDVLILNEIFGSRPRTTSMEIEEIQEEEDMKEQDEKVQVSPPRADADTPVTSSDKFIEDMVLNGMQPLTCLLKKMDDAMQNDNNTEETSSQSSADSPRPVRKTIRTNPARANTRKAALAETVDTAPVRRRGRPAKAQPTPNTLVLS